MTDGIQLSIATARSHRFFGSAVEVFETVQGHTSQQSSGPERVHSLVELVGGEHRRLLGAESPKARRWWASIVVAHGARSSGLRSEVLGVRACLEALPRVHRDDLVLITRHLSMWSGLVLDVGCWPGHLTAHLRSLGVDATGIDPVPEFIEDAHSTYPDGPYEVGSMNQLSLPDGSVAGMLAWYSLIHIPPADIDSVRVGGLRRTAISSALHADDFV